MNNYTVISPELIKKFNSALLPGRTVFFSAPCGYGKTAVSKELLRGRKTLFKSVADGDFLPEKGEEDFDVLLIDSLETDLSEQSNREICDYIKNHPEKCFVLLSRGLPYGGFMQFDFSGQLTVIDTEDLTFDIDISEELLKKYGCGFSRSFVLKLFSLCEGYPLALSLFARKFSNKDENECEFKGDIRRELYLYWEDAVYRRFDLSVRSFLIELSLFSKFDSEFAGIISGNSRAGELLDILYKNTSMLLCDERNAYGFRGAFRDFLFWKASRECSKERLKSIYDRAAVYYELRGDYKNALMCCEKNGDHRKLSALLVENAQLHPGTGHYDDMSRYYKMLPESEILMSPALMQGMSMLCALEADYKSSDRWYAALESFASKLKASDAAFKEAKSRLMWLEIALPQRGVADVADMLTNAFALLKKNRIALPPLSVTSNLPSIMNGGKDFSPWSKRDDFLYAAMKLPVEVVIAKDSIGFADCAIAESKFEKGEDITPRILKLVSKLGEIEKNGTPDVEFAVVGLLLRYNISRGNIDDAKKTVLSLKKQFEENSLDRFLPNLNALIARLALFSGDFDSAKQWYSDEAPRDVINFRVMKRYCYFTEAMCELAFGKNDTALITLAPLKTYCDVCSKYIDSIHYNILSAIALYRMGADWRENFNSAINTAGEFNFVRTVSEYGAAVLPLLKSVEDENKSEFFKKTLGETRKYAAQYPDFLRPALSLKEPLTATELQVLKLLCADKSNSEIGEVLDIKLATVKTHVSHILFKLGVDRRSEAKTAAKKLWLIK